MKKRPRNSFRTLWAMVLVLPVALACSSDDSGGGGPDAALGDQMSELGGLGDEFVGQNQQTYDTLAEAAALIGPALQNLSVPAALASKQAGCLPAELAGVTLEFTAATSTLVPGAPIGPPDAFQVRLFDSTGTDVGYFNVTCAGSFQSALIVTVSVNTANDVEVLNLVASNINVFPPSNFSATLAGTLRSADGLDEIPFGVGFEGNSIGLNEFGKSAALGFQVSGSTIANVSQNVSTDPSFPSEQIDIFVQDSIDFDPEVICPGRFYYQGAMQGTPGSLSGGGFYCARPPLGDGFNYFVNCFSGSIEDMVVSLAELSCQANIFEGEATQVSGAVLEGIQRGTDGLLGMFTTAISVAEAGGAIALEIAAGQQQQ